MNSHIEFNDLVDYIYLEKPTPDFLRQAARMNAHLFQCEKCRAQYQTILNFKQAVERFETQTSCSFSAERKEGIVRELKNDSEMAAKYLTLSEKTAEENTFFKK